MQLPVAVRRVAYRWGYRVLQFGWLLRRPEIDGVKCVITDRDRVLLVRHTYGSRRWDLPGGRIERSERPLDTARREMSEELGLRTADWVPVGELRVINDHRRDTLHLFRAEVRAPAMRIDLGELAVARWFSRAQLPDDVTSYVRLILSKVEPLLDAGQDRIEVV